jgi:AcrR family transcriptional regulator
MKREALSIRFSTHQFSSQPSKNHVRLTLGVIPLPVAINEQLIFDAALRIMTERGYVGATTKLIAEAASISEVTLFRRFGNKETLILEAMKNEAAKLDGNTSFYTGKLEADLTRIVTAYQMLLRKRTPLILTFYTEVTRYPELATVLQYPQAIIQKILNLLERYQTEGQLVKKDLMQQLAELFGPILMLMLFEVVYKGDSALNIKTHVQSFLKSNSVEDLSHHVLAK